MRTTVLILAWEIMALWASRPLSTCSVCIDEQTKNVLETSKFGCVRVKITGGPHIPYNMTYVMHVRMELFRTGTSHRHWQGALDEGFNRDITYDGTLFEFYYCAYYMKESCFTHHHFLSLAPLIPEPGSGRIPAIYWIFGFVFAVVAVMSCALCELNSVDEGRDWDWDIEDSRQNLLGRNGSTAEEGARGLTAPKTQQHRESEAEITDNTQVDSTSHADSHTAASTVVQSNYSETSISHVSTSQAVPNSESENVKSENPKWLESVKGKAVFPNEKLSEMARGRSNSF